MLQPGVALHQLVVGLLAHLQRVAGVAHDLVQALMDLLLELPGLRSVELQLEELSVWCLQLDVDPLVGLPTTQEFFSSRTS
jgi:hypothetical protein